jgi:hypothetical protein
MNTQIQETLNNESVANANPATVNSNNPNWIIYCVCDYFKIEMEELASKKQRREVVMPRQIAMYFLCKFTHLPLKTIGERFGRDHSTVLYGKDTVSDIMKIDKSFKNKIADIEYRILNNNISDNPFETHDFRVLALEQAGKLPNQTCHELLQNADKIEKWLIERMVHAGRAAHGICG